ncbi:MAG: 16S rRNA (guanine(527)-N(7))-methyltransferase RsmG [Methylophilaceae bacterium]|nr:16S rRNA (guanine(527)-N(7))-methyltransferase RsmG [Methylophilaceae bacterium]
MSELAEKLAAGIAEMGLQFSPEKQQSLLGYLALLAKWNKVYNLTAVRDPLEMVTLHLLDSLSVLSYIDGKSLLDVGSGGGLPGIVLAICLPDLQVTTIDTVQKKAIFMRQVKGELGLSNLQVVNARVEEYEAEPFELIISRAFSDLNLFMAFSQHLLAEDGRWLAMKGVSPQQDLEALKVKSKVYPLSVAGLEAERHLAIIEKF